MHSDSPNQPPEDDGLTVVDRLKPDQFDVILGAHPGKGKTTPAKASGSFTTVAIFLALLAAIVYLVLQMFHTGKPVAVAVAPPSTPVVTTHEPETAPTAPIIEPLRTTEQVLYVASKVEAAAAESKSLEGCLKNGNVIDQDVINCRFGEAQRTDYNASRSQGMVSDRYMAEYKSAAAKPKIDSGRHYEVAGVFIREIDGRDRYEARYRIFDNRIDTSSVCFNFKTDSAEYRECRRAAQPFFKESCSDWTKRTAKDRNEKNKRAQEQYCEAARTYQP